MNLETGLPGDKSGGGGVGGRLGVGGWGGGEEGKQTCVSQNQRKMFFWKNKYRY